MAEACICLVWGEVNFPGLWEARAQRMDIQDEAHIIFKNVNLSKKYSQMLAHGRHMVTLFNIIFQICFLHISAHMPHREVFLENSEDVILKPQCGSMCLSQRNFH